jgi:DMSO/TMAO reductase YedYZ molybdopterin-dependent catalytic subunit
MEKRERVTMAGAIESPDTKRQDRRPPGQRLTTDFPVLHYGDVHHLDRAKWKLRIWGLVEKEIELDLPSLLSLGTVKVHCDIHCVTTWSRLDNLFEGVPSGAIRKIVKIRKEARAVMVHGAGDFTTNLLFDDFFADDVVLATRHDGKEIDDDHGAPVRLVVPRLYFWKSAKWVTGIEFIEKDRPGFWESNGYHMRGDPWREQRRP